MKMDDIVKGNLKQAVGDNGRSSYRGLVQVITDDRVVSLWMRRLEGPGFVSCPRQQSNS